MSRLLVTAAGVAAAALAGGVIGLASAGDEVAVDTSAASIDPAAAALTTRSTPARAVLGLARPDRAPKGQGTAPAPGDAPPKRVGADCDAIGASIGELDYQRLDRRTSPRTPEAAARAVPEGDFGDLKIPREVRFERDRSQPSYGDRPTRVYVGLDRSGRARNVYRLLRGERGAWAVKQIIECRYVPVDVPRYPLVFE